MPKLKTPNLLLYLNAPYLNLTQNLQTKAQNVEGNHISQIKKTCPDSIWQFLRYQQIDIESTWLQPSINNDCKHGHVKKYRIFHSIPISQSISFRSFVLCRYVYVRAIQICLYKQILLLRTHTISKMYTLMCSSISYQNAWPGAPIVIYNMHWSWVYFLHVLTYFECGRTSSFP